MRDTSASLDVRPTLGFFLCTAAGRAGRCYERHLVRWPGGGRRVLHHPVGEGAGDRGGAAGDTQRLVDVFQVGAHGSLGDAQPPGDLGVGVPGGQQAQQLVLPPGEPGDGMAAGFGL